MAGSFDKLRDEMSLYARDRVSQRVRDTLLEMTLEELRQNTPKSPRLQHDCVLRTALRNIARSSTTRGRCSMMTI